MKSSEARMLMERHLAAFFAASPDAVPPDLHPDVSPIYAMGRAHGLTIASARRYVAWLVETDRVAPEEAAGLHTIVEVTAQVWRDAMRHANATGLLDDDDDGNNTDPYYCRYCGRIWYPAEGRRCPTGCEDA